MLGKSGIIIALALGLCACGGDHRTSHAPSSSTGSTSLAGTTSSSLSGTTSSVAGSLKLLQMEFNQDTCLHRHNADTQTDFDFANQSFRILRWNCVKADTSWPVPENLSLLLPFDKTQGCFTKMDSELTLHGGVYENKRKPDCTDFAEPVNNPKMAAEIVEVNYFFKPDRAGVENRYELTYSFRWKNSGNLPIIGFKIVALLGSDPLTSMRMVETAESNLALPDETLSVLPSTLGSSDFTGGKLMKLTLKITDYFDNTLAEAEQDIVVQ